VFGYFEGYEAQPVKLQVAAKDDWPVFLTLEPQFPAALGKASGLANDFYELADSQVLLGPRFILHKTDAGVPLYVAIYGEGPADPGRITAEAEATLERMIEYFGGAVFPFYTVHMEFLKPVSEQHRYGFSMEHLTSSTFYLGHEAGLRADSPAAETSRVRYNFAHHFAHAWIPKRAYGEGYFPHLWETAPVLDTIWFSEGFAQYAALDALADAEGNDAAVFRARFVQRRFRSTLTEVPPFLLRLPLVEVSRIASTRYSEDFRTGRTAFSRGGLMAAEMDERIRSESARQKRLRDALRFLVKWSQREKRAFRIEELPTIFREATGVDTRDILEKWLAPYTPAAQQP
jgi:predicted metalloprotease with PDZ domain